MSNLAIKQNNENTQMLSIIEKVALDPNSNVKKLRELLALKEHIFDKNAEIEFNDAMSRVQAELPAVLKNANNPQTHSKYAKLDKIIQICAPTWTKHGFALSFGTDNSKLNVANHVGITCIVSHCNGFSRKYRWDLPLDGTGIKGSVNKTPIHAHGSTISYGRRYLTCMIFNIATQDDDDGTAGNTAIDYITVEQQDDLTNLATKANYQIGRLQYRFNAKSLDKIRLSDYTSAVKFLKSMIISKETQEMFEKLIAEENALDMYLFLNNMDGEKYAQLLKTIKFDKTKTKKLVSELSTKGRIIFNEIYDAWITAIKNNDELGRKENEDFGIFQEVGIALLHARKIANKE